MKNIPLLLGTIFGTVILIVIVAFMFSGDSGTQQTTSEPVSQEVLLEGARHPYSATQDQSQNQAEGESQDATDSSEVAEETITIVEFSDFQCPACKAALPALEAVKSAYPGNVEVFYRHFPLDSIHPNARRAAIASEAAAALQPENPAVFWQYHDILFENQQSWSEIRSRDELTDTFASYAEELGIDRTAFLEKMEDDSIAQLVNEDVSLGTRLGVNATPTFYVNGIKTSAPQLLTTVETMLNK